MSRVCEVKGKQGRGQFASMQLQLGNRLWCPSAWNPIGHCIITCTAIDQIISVISATSPCYNHSWTKFASKTYHHLNKAFFARWTNLSAFAKSLQTFTQFKIPQLRVFIVVTWRPPTLFYLICVFRFLKVDSGLTLVLYQYNMLNVNSSMPVPVETRVVAVFEASTVWNWY